MVNTLIVGAGSIGAMKDEKYDSQISENVLTHANAIYRNPDFELIGIVDTDKDKAFAAGVKWNCKWTTKFEYCEDIDLVIISTPTETHCTVYKEVCEVIKPKTIILEKPAGISVEECNAMQKFGKRTIINYTRNIFEQYQSTVDWIKKEQALFACAKYGHGLKRDGCHLVAFLHNLFGDFVMKNHINHLIDDGEIGDLSLGGLLWFEDCEKVYLIPVDSRIVSCFELEIITNKHRFVFTNGMENIDVFVHGQSVYGDYKSLTGLHQPLISQKVNIAKDYFPSLYANLDDVQCGFETAVAAHKIMEAMS